MESFGADSRESTQRTVEQERIRQTYEYKNSRGEVIARARLEFDQQEVPSGFKLKKNRLQEGMARRLRSFVIEGSPVIGGVQVDLMPVINPHNAKTLVVEGLLNNYHAGKDERGNDWVVVPSLKTLLGIGVLSHELGHVDQNYDHRMGDVVDMLRENKYIIFGQGSLKSILDVKKRTENFLKRFSETKGLLKSEDERRLEAFEQEEERLETLGIECKNDLIRLEDERNQELPRFLIERLESQHRPTPDALIKACDEAQEHLWIGSSREEGKELVPPLVQLAEKIGFRFAAPGQMHQVPDHSLFGIPPLSPGWLDGPHDLARLAQDFKFGGKSFRSDYHEQEEMLIIEQAFKPNVHLDEQLHVRMEIPCSPKEWKEYSERLHAIDEKIAAAKNRLEEHNKKITEWKYHVLSFISQSSYYDILYYPRRKIEVDATRRAFEWLRWLRDTHGINLLQIVDVNADSVELMQVLEDMCGGVERPRHQEKRTRKVPGTSIGKDLRRALKTYGAHKLPLGLEKKKPKQKFLPN